MWRGCALLPPVAARPPVAVRSRCPHDCVSHPPSHTLWPPLPANADEGLKLFGEDADYGSIAREIEGVAGVVAHGLVSRSGAGAG